jgi:hypothetical protein
MTAQSLADLSDLALLVHRIATRPSPTVWADLSADLDLADVITHAAGRADLDPTDAARQFIAALGGEPSDLAATRDDLYASARALQSGKGQAGAVAALGGAA